MAKVLQHRRDTTANLSSVSGAIGEFFMDTTKNTLVVMDGSTNGGHPLALESSLSSYATSTDLTTGLSGKQDTLVSGTSIKTINGTSLLGSGNITISGEGGGGDLSAVAEDILPSFDAVYDLGSTTNQWYDLFVSNSVTIGGGSLSGNATGLVTNTMLLGDLLVTTNTITPDASTALQYNGDQGVVDILGNLDVSTGDWLLPAVVETADTEQQIDKAVSYVTDWNDGEPYLQFDAGVGSGNINMIRINGFSSLPAAKAFWNEIKPSNATQGKITLSFTGSINWSYAYSGADVSYFEWPGSWWSVDIYVNHNVDGEIPSVNTGVIRTVNVAYTGLAPTPPLTTGTEGAIRYNKDNAALELYTDSWNNLSAAGYTNSDVDTHLNTSTASSSQVLSWNGSDYAWVAQSSGGSSGMTADIIAAYSTTTAGTYADVSGYKQVKVTGHFGDGVNFSSPYLQLRNSAGSNTGPTVGSIGWGKWWRNTGSNYTTTDYTTDLGAYIYMGMNGDALDGIFEVEFTIDGTTMYIETKTISSTSSLPQQGFRGYYTENVSGSKYFYFNNDSCYNVVIRGYN